MSWFQSHCSSILADHQDPKGSYGVAMSMSYQFPGQPCKLLRSAACLKSDNQRHWGVGRLKESLPTRPSNSWIWSTAITATIQPAIEVAPEWAKWINLAPKLLMEQKGKAFCTQEVDLTLMQFITLILMPANLPQFCSARSSSPGNVMEMTRMGGPVKMRHQQLCISGCAATDAAWRHKLRFFQAKGLGMPLLHQHM